MTYRLVWPMPMIERLEGQYMRAREAGHGNAFTAAIHRLEQDLLADPLAVGESRDGNCGPGGVTQLRGTLTRADLLDKRRVGHDLVFHVGSPVVFGIIPLWVQAPLRPQPGQVLHLG